VPTPRVFTLPDIFDDPHYHAREMLLSVPHAKLGSVTLQGIVPKLSCTPGQVTWPGPEGGADTRSVLSELLGLSSAQLDALAAAGVIRDSLAETKADASAVPAGRPSKDDLPMKHRS
jgi:crotonobetainyl-CoA:carnitine CoA-transferase CaiB-like acyl-CoA transferase